MLYVLNEVAIKTENWQEEKSCCGGWGCLGGYYVLKKTFYDHCGGGGEGGYDHCDVTLPCDVIGIPPVIS